MTMAAPNCCRWRRGSGTATVRAHARRRPLSRSQAGKTKTGKRCALSDPEHLASLALACYEIRDTSRTFIVANSASPYADASPASAPCGCGADHAKRSRLEVRLSPFASRREEPTGGLGGLLLGRGELGDRSFHGCAALEEEEVVDEPERFDSEHGRNFPVADGQQVVAVALFAAEGEV